MQSKALELNERQRLFFKARRRFIAYGGARGGGKTWAVREKADVLAHRYPGINILIVRRTHPELLQNHILPLQLELSGLARWNDNQKRFIFPNGSNIWFGYCAAERDVGRYQGQEYDIIFIETYAKSIRDAYAKLCDLEERIAMLNQLSQLDD